jgi:hypothetical protein
MKLNNMNSTQRMMRIMLIGMIALLAMTALLAQEATVAGASPFYKPGDTIRISITFDGSDVGDIHAAQVTIRNFAEPEKGQQGFNTVLNGGDSKRASRNTFEVSIKVPDIIASGEYRLHQIYITFEGGRPPVYYTMETDFKEKLLFHIKNSKHFEDPKITSISELR